MHIVAYVRRVLGTSLQKIYKTLYVSKIAKEKKNFLFYF